MLYNSHNTYKSHLILKTLLGRYYYYSHCIDKEIEDPRDCFTQGRRSSKFTA